MELLNWLRSEFSRSPYLSRKMRVELEEWLGGLKSDSGDAAFEEAVNNYAKKMVLDEIDNLKTKIFFLNPQSPRVVYLREIHNKLIEGSISVKKAHEQIFDLMNGGLG